MELEETVLRKFASSLSIALITASASRATAVLPLEVSVIVGVLAAALFMLASYRKPAK